MKNKIHPKYFPKAKVTCACGNSFTTGSTQKEIRVELCSVCHPFYTGKQKLVDTARRVEKFQAKIEAKKEVSKVRKGRKVKRAIRVKTKAQKEKTIKVNKKIEEKVGKK